MVEFIFAIITQALPFIPLAFGISVSYSILRATDMTIDGSFVLGAAVFARLVTLGVSPYVAALFAIFSGALAGMLAAYIQRGGRIEPLLAGVLATFILSSLNLSIMGKPNIGLLMQPTLISSQNEFLGWIQIGAYVLLFCGITFFLLKTRFGLFLRAFGDNPLLLKRLGKNVEMYRLLGFALTNALAASAGCLTAQVVGYADIGMGFGMTLTGIGAIILGQQLFSRLAHLPYLRTTTEFLACLFGVVVYFFALNLLLRFSINPIYLKMILGMVLIAFLRTAAQPRFIGNVS